MAAPKQSAAANRSSPYLSTGSVMGDDRKHDKMYICLEAHNKKTVKNQYLIFSIRKSDLITQLSDNAVPHLNLEKLFDGTPSMGCGLYESKIVFTGGKIKRNGFITFDFTTQKLSHKSFPLMQSGKVKPLVFQLNKRLYVFDVSSCFYEGAFEYYNPFEDRWYNLLLPHDAPFLRCRKFHADRKNPQHNYSFLLFANTCYFHIPPYDDLMFVHHPNYIHQTWLPLPITHPFSGASTFYRQDGFLDSVVFSFENRAVTAHRFCMHNGYPDDPIHLFDVEPSSESNAIMSGYFADFQGGIFTLTAYDDVCIYLYTFKVFLTGEEDFSVPMTIDCSVISKYQIKFISLPLGARMLGVIGCFSSSPNLEALKSADELFSKSMMRFAKRCNIDSRKVEIDGAKPRLAPSGPRGEMSWVSRQNGDKLLVVT